MSTKACNKWYAVSILRNATTISAASVGRRRREDVVRCEKEKAEEGLLLVMGDRTAVVHLRPDLQMISFVQQEYASNVTAAISVKVHYFIYF